MKTYQNLFHGTIVSLLVISGIGMIGTLGLFLWVGIEMILSIPAGWPQLWVSVFLMAFAGALFGVIYQRFHPLFSPWINPAGPQEEKTTGKKVVQIKRDQSVTS
ncbi:MAG: hypothetical protein WBK96_16660 [Candidatus Manganitrophaceae bacterium]